ncbi:MAG: histone H1-like repetitive region-containing protein [Hyphomicrobium sp.]|nr:histone H1-like repetitive region-containing protein [Hyphomicrobium sp.]
MDYDKEMQKFGEGDELLVDGGFEQADVRANTWTTLASVGGWKSDSGIEVWGKNFNGTKPTDGKNIVELDADHRQSNIYQDVQTKAGVEYTFSFDYMKRADSKAGSDTIEIYWNGKMVGSVDPTQTSWSQASFVVTGTGGKDRIEFRESSGDNDSYGGLIDNASLKVSEDWLEKMAQAEKNGSGKSNSDDDKHDGRGHGDGDHNDDGHSDNGRGSMNEKAEKEKAEKEAAEKAEKERAEKAAAEKAAAEKAAAEKAAAEKAAAEKVAAEKAAAEKAAAEKAAAEKAAAEKAAAEKAAAEKAAAEKAAAEKAAAEKAAAEKAAAEKAAAEKAAAEKAAAEKAAAEKAAAEKAAAEKAAAEKAAAEKAAAEKAAAEKAAAEKAAAEKAAAEKAAAEKAAAEDADHDDTIIGTSRVDTLEGDEHANLMYGKGSNDTVKGGDGDDFIMGGSGDDALYGQVGNDQIFGAGSLGGAADMSKFRASVDTTATVTFDYESAGYRNALGLYKIAKDGSIYGVEVLFENASLKGSGGDLVGGVSSVDVDLKAGERIGFFVVPNGFDQSGMAKLLSDTKGSFKFVGSDGKAGNVNSGKEVKLVHVSEKGVETVVTSQYGNSVFHSISGLNGDKLDHVKGQISVADGTVKIGFEDLWGGGDKDFDDSVFTMKVGQTNAALLSKVSSGVISTDHDVIRGGVGDDKLFGMAGNDKVMGGAGNDQIWGNSGNDTINGGAGHDVISGGSGNDTIRDGLGNDRVDGNSGDDKVFAGEGNDAYVGSAGFDTIDFSGAKQAMTIDLSKSSAVGMGADTLKGFEAIVGSAFGDNIKGSKDANVINGGAGDDVIRGLGGADMLKGGAGRDTFQWSMKDVVGSSGQHLGMDTIADLEAGDRIDIKALLKGQSYSKLSDVVKVADVNGDAKLSVKIGSSFVDVVTIDDMSANDLLASGMILT